MGDVKALKVDGSSSTDVQKEEAFAAAEEMPKQVELTPADLRAKELRTKAPPLDAFADDVLEMMARRRAGKELPIPIPWLRLGNAMRGGFWPGLYVLAGGTGAGKSQWAMQTVLEAALTGHPTLYIGLELDRAQLYCRLASLLLHRQGKRAPIWSDLYNGSATPDDYRAVEEVSPELRRLPIRLEEGESYGWSADNLRERVLAMRDAFPEPDGPGSLPILVVLDYLQVIAPPAGDERQELRVRIAQAAYAARALAKDRTINPAILLLSSIARTNAEALGKEAAAGTLGAGDPNRLVGMGKESGEIEFGADAVLTFAKEWQEDGPSLMHVALAKARGAPAGWHLMRFNGGWFEEATDAERESARARAEEAVRNAGEAGKNYRAEQRAKAKEADRETAEAKARTAEEKRKAAEIRAAAARVAIASPELP